MIIKCKHKLAQPGAAAAFAFFINHNFKFTFGSIIIFKLFVVAAMFCG